MIRVIGLPLKIVLVAGSSVMFRLRPRAVNILVPALAAELAWHIAGFAASPA